MYTQEQNEEIESVMKVFSEYIRDTNYFDLVWSDKLGYVLLNGITDDGDELCMEPTVLRDGAFLFDEIIYHIACDLMKKRGKSCDLTLGGQEEQEAIREVLLPYSKQLPEYGYLIDELFIRRG